MWIICLWGPGYGIDPPETVMGGCKLPSMGVGPWTQVLCESCRCSRTPNYFSSPASGTLQYGEILPPCSGFQPWKVLSLTREIKVAAQSIQLGLVQGRNWQENQGAGAAHTAPHCFGACGIDYQGVQLTQRPSLPTFNWPGHRLRGLWDSVVTVSFVKMNS